MTAEASRIVLAEDSDRDFELALDALDALGLADRVVRMRNGVEVLDYLHRRGAWAGSEAGPPAVVLLDLKMPLVDGMDVLRQVKADPELRTTPVVVMSSSRHESDLVAAYAAGANAYVVKSVRYDEFVEAVKLVGHFWARLNARPGTDGSEDGR